MSMSMSMKNLYSANSLKSNLRRWRVWLDVIGRSKKVRFKTGLEGNVVGQINEVTLRQARLVLGWVTVYGRVNHLGM